MKQMRMRYRKISIALIIFVVFINLVGIILVRLQDNISFFCTVTEVMNGVYDKRKIIRVGGTVREGSVLKKDDSVSFEVTDEKNSIKVIYKGLLPPIFMENSSVIVKGKVVKGIFLAEEVFSKHDENYIPKKYKLGDIRASEGAG